MQREMRRGAQALSQADCEGILCAATSGVLAVLGDEGFPYAVPLSFAYRDGALYFHCAVEGHKLDAIRREPKASFCVIAQDEVVALRYTTKYRSVIAFGRVRELTNAGEKRDALLLLAHKYAPMDDAPHQETFIEKHLSGLCVLRMDIDHLSGKQGKLLLQSE